MWHDFGGPSQSSYDFRRCHDDFMWHDFGASQKSYTMSYDSVSNHVRLLEQLPKVIYDVIGFCFKSMKSYNRIRYHVTFVWKHVLLRTTPQNPVPAPFSFASYPPSDFAPKRSTPKNLVSAPFSFASSPPGDSAPPTRYPAEPCPGSCLLCFPQKL